MGITTMTRSIISAFIAVATAFSMGFAPQTESVEVRDELPIVGTYDNLQEIIKEADGNIQSLCGDGMKTAIQFDAMTTQATRVTETANTEATDYSTTNVQVVGVDEADIVKNDDKYIYHLIDQKVVITEAYPAKDMSVKCTIEYKDNFHPIELFIDKDRMIVIGTSYDNYLTKNSRNITKAIVYNIVDRKNPKIIKEVEAEGEYVSSRRIGDYLYFVSNKYIWSYMFEENNEFDILPIYRDSVTGAEYKNVSCDMIRYFPDSKASNFMLTVGVDLSNTKSEANVTTYLGSGETIYSSADNMYVAVMKCESNVKEDEGSEFKRAAFPYVENQINTLIYKFELEKGKISYDAKQEVPGTILNQFSMDESDGHFRIATTTGSVMGTGDNVSKNNMYVLDNNMNIVGKIEDIAPGEKIYSVRFMGDRAYMVTFRKVDPLFVIDLKDPKNPTILGKLKIPGYSDYLHPYDENHIIGFGKDAEVVSSEGNWGWADENKTVAYYQGMKIAIFDVTDPNNPTEMFTEKIGDRGTTSPLLYDHKALLFSKEKNLLAFPITVTTRAKGADAWAYGETSFVGAYVYDVNLKKGFELKGKLTDLSDIDMKKMGYWYYDNNEIDRIIYIENVIYTISDNGYGAYKMDTLQKIADVKI